MSEIMLNGAVNGVNLVDALMGPVTWDFDGHVRVGAYHDDEAGLSSTLMHPGSWVTVEEVLGHTRVTFDPRGLAGRDACGTFQVDVERFAGDSGADATFGFGHGCGSIVVPPKTPLDPTPTPEASTWLLFAMGLAMLVSCVRRQRRLA